MAWVEKTTSWNTHVAVPMTTPAANGGSAGVVSRSRILSMYPGDPPQLRMPPFLPFNLSEEGIGEDFPVPSGSGESTFLFHVNNQKDLQDNFSTLSPHWIEGVTLATNGPIIIEDDGYDWCEIRGFALRDAWVAANPDKYFMSIEWEGWESGVQLGSHTDHKFYFETTEAQGWWYEYKRDQDTGDVYKENMLRAGEPIPNFVGGIRMALPLNFDTTQYGYQPSYHQYASISGLFNYKWTMDSLKAPFQSSPITNLIPSQEYEIDLEYYMTQSAIELYRGNSPSRVTRGLLTVVFPDAVPILREYDYRWTIEAGPGVLTTNYQPPRWRVRYQQDDTVEPPEPEPIESSFGEVRRRFT